MKPNVGSTDGAARVWVALFVSVALMLGALPAQMTWVALAAIAVLLGTAVAGFCPFYRLFNHSTFHEDKHLDY